MYRSLKSSSTTSGTIKRFSNTCEFDRIWEAAQKQEKKDVL